MTNKVSKNIVRGLVLIIKLYQKTLSADHGWLRLIKPYGSCRFLPTCSQYMIEALESQGLVKGFKKGLRRLGRCHPWTIGGWDPVDNNLEKN